MPLYFSYSYFHESIFGEKKLVIGRLFGLRTKSFDEICSEIDRCKFAKAFKILSSCECGSQLILNEKQNEA